jgi:hypothetical protein
MYQKFRFYKIYSYRKQFIFAKNEYEFFCQLGVKGRGKGGGGRSTNIPFLRFLGRGWEGGGREEGRGGGREGGRGWGRNPINSTFSFLNPGSQSLHAKKLRNNMTRTDDQ